MYYIQIWERLDNILLLEVYEYEPARTVSLCAAVCTKCHLRSEGKKVKMQRLKSKQ